MMTGAVVTPSLGGLVVGCVLLLTGTVSVVLTITPLFVGCMLLLTGTVSVVVTITPLFVGCMLLLTGTVVVIGPTVWRGLNTI